MKPHSPSCSAFPCHSHCTGLPQKSGTHGQRAERSSVNGMVMRGVSCRGVGGRAEVGGGPTYDELRAWDGAPVSGQPAHRPGPDGGTAQHSLPPLPWPPPWHPAADSRMKSA